MHKNKRLDQAYRHALQLARQHYENFPVASVLLPLKLKKSIAVIYAFARLADDIADEGQAPSDQRIAKLNELEQQLDQALAGQSVPDLFLALADTIKRHQLEPRLFKDLLSAFKQDCHKTRYANFGELMDYCRRSANPVGRLLLQLMNIHDERMLAQSDAICSALQLINMCQDWGEDFTTRERLYFPLDELEKFGLTEEMIARQQSTFQTRQFMQFQLNRAHKLLRAGSPLGKTLKGRFGFEIRMIIMGGKRTCEQLIRRENHFQAYKLHYLDWLRIIWDAIKGRFKPV